MFINALILLKTFIKISLNNLAYLRAVLVCKKSVDFLNKLLKIHLLLLTIIVDLMLTVAQ